MQINTMEQLKEKAILVTEETEFFYPLSNETETFDPTAFSPAYRMRYAYNGGVISFIDEFNQWFIIPCIKGTVETLERIGYKKACFFVPCSNLCSYPLKHKIHWNRMLAEMRAA